MVLKIGLQPNLFLKSPIDEAVKQILALNPDCIEIVYETPQFTPNSQVDNKLCEKLKETLSTSKAEPSVHSSFFELNLGSQYQETRKLAINQIMKCIDFSSRINAKMITIHSGYFPLTDNKNRLRLTARERFENDLKTCLNIADDQGICLSIENMDAPYFFIHSIEEATRLAQKIKGLGITLDIAHLHKYKSKQGIRSPEKQIAEEIVTFLENRLTHLHLSDNVGVDDSHLPPGDGQITFKPVIEAIKKIKYAGQVILELWKQPNPAQAGIKALKIARKFFHD